jgi:Protein of unknown function (DUF2961)
MEQHRHIGCRNSRAADNVLHGRLCVRPPKLQGSKSLFLLMLASLMMPLQVTIIPMSYRFHLADPIHFAERISVTLEHGHANHLSDDWSSTAYWYQTLPSPVRTILPVEQRLPIISGEEKRAPAPAESEIDSEHCRAALEAARKRMDEYKKVREEHLWRKIERTREYSRRNIEQAKALRLRYESNKA